jgi:hypothetical protein
MQVPEQVVAQQMLPTQWPFAHWVSPRQAPPLACLGTQVPVGPGLWQKSVGFAQSLSAAHAVAQAVLLAHTKRPGHALAVALPHVPVPEQVAAGVNSPLLQEGARQVTVAAACAQVPPAAQCPSLPHGGDATHWPAGADDPAVRLAQVPLGWPVSAVVQAWQVPVHVVLQHTPPTQFPFAHCPFDVQT